MSVGEPALEVVLEPPLTVAQKTHRERPPAPTTIITQRRRSDRGDPQGTHGGDSPAATARAISSMTPSIGMLS
jgi:hypothetical protein